MNFKASSRLAEDMKQVEPLVDEICTAAPENLALILESNMEWNRPTGDLLHWTRVLNVFDSVFEKKISAYGLDAEYPKPNVMAPEDSRLVVACLKFTSLLFRNCRTRNLYASQERIYQLCVCGDVDVLFLAMDMALQLSLKYLRSSSKKNPPPKQVKQHFLDVAKFYPPPVPISFIQKSLNQSAAGGTSATDASTVPPTEDHKYEHYSLSDSLNSCVKYPSKWRALNFQFYSTCVASGGEKFSKKTKKQTFKQHEGISTIAVPEDKVRSANMQQLYDFAVTHDLPEEFRLLFLLSCLNAKAFNSTLTSSMGLRSKLLRIKSMAFSVICCFCSTDFASTNLFEVEAYTFGFMVDLISPLNTHISRDVFNVAATCLEVISMKRVWGTEIVRLMGGNVRHGILYQLMKHITKLVRGDEPDINEEGFYTFFEMIENLEDTKVLTTRSAAVGLLQDLTEFLAIPTSHKRLSSIVASIVNNFLDGFSENIALFAENNGFKSVIQVIDREVNSILNNPAFEHGPPKHYDAGGMAALNQLEFLGNALNILFTIVESDLGDRMQNLMDLPILATFKRILGNANIIGEFVVSSALNVVYKTIHNEPTAFALFNESGVIDTIVKNYALYFGPTFTWPTILVEILGAVSLNNEGLQKVIDNKLVHVFFQSFLQFDCAKEMMEDDVLSSLALCFEELSRHFPAYQPIIIEEIRYVAQELPQVSQKEISALKFYTSESGNVFSSADDETTDSSKQRQPQEEGETIDTWASQKGSVMVDSFLIFCRSLVQDCLAWSVKLPDVVPFTIWNPVLGMDTPFDFSASAGYSALRVLTRLTSDSSKCYAFSPLVDMSFGRLRLPQIMRFINHPVDKYFLKELGDNPTNASRFLLELNQLHTPLHLLSLVFLDNFDGDAEQIKKYISEFAQTPALVRNLVLLLQKCVAEQSFLLSSTPVLVLSETTPYLLRSETSGFSALHKPSGTLKDRRANAKNTLQYRALVHLVGSAALLALCCVCRMPQYKKLESLNAEQRRLAVILAKEAISELQTVFEQRMMFSDSIKLYYSRGSVKALIYACTSKEVGDLSLSLPALTIISLELNFITYLVEYAIEIFRDLEQKGTAELQQELYESTHSPYLEQATAHVLYASCQMDILREIFVFLGRLVCEEDIAFLPSLVALYNVEYCLDEELIRDGVMSANAVHVYGLISEIVGTKSLVFKANDFSIFSVLPNKVSRALFDLIQVAWALNPTDTLFPLREDWMGISQVELDYMVKRLGMDRTKSEEILRNYGSLYCISEISAIDKKIAKKIYKSDFKKVIRYDPVASDVGRTVSALRQQEDTAMFGLTFIKIAAQQQLCDVLFMQTMGFLSCGDRTMTNLNREILSHKGADLVAHIEEVGNMVRLQLQLVLVVPVGSFVDETTKKKKAFQEFAAYFLTELSAKPELVDTAFGAQGLKFVTPLLSQTPSCVLEGIEIQFPDFEVSAETKQQLCDILFRVDPKESVESFLSVCHLLYLFLKDDQYKKQVQSSSVLELLMRKIPFFIEKCTFAQVHSIQDATIQMMRISYESNYFVESMLEARLRAVVKMGFHDIQSVFDECAYAANRAPQRFVDVASRVLRLENCSEESHSTRVYVPKETDIKDENNEVRVELRGAGSAGLVTVLLSMLMKLAREDWFSTPIDVQTEQQLDARVTQFALLLLNRKFRTMCFILHSLCELLGSYMPAKLEFITFSKKEKSTEGNKPRTTSLNFFIHQLISSSLTDKSGSETELQRRTTISSLAKMCLCALMSTPEQVKEPANRFSSQSNAQSNSQSHSNRSESEDPDLAVVRKLTADLVAKLLRESVPFPRPAADIYAKVHGVFSLCSLLLSAKQSEMLQTPDAENATKMDIFHFAAALLDAQVPLHTSAVLAVADLNFPGVKRVANAALRVLNSLARIKLANTSLLESPTLGDRDDDELGDVEDRDDTPDLFRNSTLGFYDIDVDSDEHDEYFDEEAYAELLASEMSEDDEDEISDFDMEEENIDSYQDYEGDEDVFEGSFEGSFQEDSDNSDVEIIGDLDIQSDEGESVQPGSGESGTSEWEDYESGDSGEWEQYGSGYDSEDDWEYFEDEYGNLNQDLAIQIPRNALFGQSQFGQPSHFFATHRGHDETHHHALSHNHPRVHSHGAHSHSTIHNRSGRNQSVDWDRWLTAFGEPTGSMNVMTGRMNIDDNDSALDDEQAESLPVRSFMTSFLDALRPAELNDPSRAYRPLGETSNPLARLANLRALLNGASVPVSDDVAIQVDIRSTSERWRSELQSIPKLHTSKLLKAIKTRVLDAIRPDSIRLYKEKQKETQKNIEEHRARRELRHLQRHVSVSQADREPPLTTLLDSSGAQEEQEAPQEAPQEEHVPVYVNIGDRAVDIGGTDIDPEFFEALPEDMREEVFTQHVRERRASNHAVREIDPDFLAALPLRIREDILNQERMARRAGALFNSSDRHFALHSDSELDVSTLGDEDTEPSLPLETSVPQKKKTFETPLVDRSGVASLARLLFVPVPITQRESLYRTLVSVSHNKQTRSEAVSVLLSILSDGLTSQRSLERMFAQLTARSGGKDTGDAEKTLPMGATPITTGIQVIEAVLNLLEEVPSLRVFMLTEHENPHLSKKHLKKTATEDKYPLNLVLKLLENPLLSEEYFFVDLLASVVHYATLPLLALRDPGKQVPTLFHSAFILDRNLRLITRILSSGECLNSTFKRTMSSIQHLSMLQGARAVLLKELAENAAVLGARVVQELGLVTQELVMNPSDDALNNKRTADFTALSSNQAKLLRVLTALDYMFSSPRDDSDFSSVYLRLKLGALWEALSECLGLFEANTKVASNATALLPLIEALMVVCKHSKVKDVQIKEMMRTQEKQDNPAAEAKASETDNREAGKNFVSDSLKEGKLASDTKYGKEIKYTGRKVDFSNEPLERLFFSFTEEHKKILNQMVRTNPNLMSGPFSMLVRNPRVLEFDNKRNYFDRQLHDSSHVPQKMAFTVRRDQVFLDSYRSLFFKSSQEFKQAQLEITFKGELGVDAGGVTREWYQVLSRQMFNPDYALFTPVTSDENTFHPNRTSYVNPEHLSFFKFIGRIIGKSIYDGCLLDCHFSRAVYKNILDRAVSLKDMETLDLDYFKSLMWMLENDISDIITEDFSVEADDYGEHKTIDLVPNGRNISVTEENKQEYVKQVVQYRLQTSVQEQMTNFISGFHEIIPKDLVAIFDEQELELLILGLPDIDVQDWQNNTIYQNYSPSSDQIVWFWRSVRSFDNEERAKLLQFATGTSKVPLNGFKDLRGANNVSKFNIHRDYGSTDRLPSSHTCFNQIDLPVYESYETLRGSLLLAITEGYEGFQLA